MSGQLFNEKVESLKNEVRALVDDFTAEQVEETAVRLEGLNFTPPVITPIAQFVRLRNDTLIQEIDRIVNMPEAEACALAPDNTLKCEDLRIQHITVTIFHYKKLLELRKGSSEEWDEVDELYVHD